MRGYGPTGSLLIPRSPLNIVRLSLQAVGRHSCSHSRSHVRVESSFELSCLPILGGSAKQEIPARMVDINDSSFWFHRIGAFFVPPSPRFWFMGEPSLTNPMGGTYPAARSRALLNSASPSPALWRQTGKRQQFGGVPFTRNS